MLAELTGWFKSLHATFIFILLLPVAVAIAGLLADLVRPRAGDASRGQRRSD